MNVGERFWYWFSVTSPELPLLIEKFSDPKGIDRLNKRVASLERTKLGLLSRGIGTVRETGTLQFAGPQSDEDMLTFLANWVGGHAGTYPAWAHLKDAQFINVSPEGIVRAVHEDKY